MPTKPTQPLKLEYGQCRCMYNNFRDPTSKKRDARWYIGGFGMFDVAYHGDYDKDYADRCLDPEKISLYDVPQGMPGLTLTIGAGLKIYCQTRGLAPALDRQHVTETSENFRTLSMAMKVIEDVLQVEFPVERQKAHVNTDA